MKFSQFSDYRYYLGLGQLCIGGLQWQMPSSNRMVIELFLFVWIINVIYFLGVVTVEGSTSCFLVSESIKNLQLFLEINFITIHQVSGCRLTSFQNTTNDSQLISAKINDIYGFLHKF